MYIFCLFGYVCVCICVRLGACVYVHICSCAYFCVCLCVSLCVFECYGQIIIIIIIITIYSCAFVTCIAGDQVTEGFLDSFFSIVADFGNTVAWIISFLPRVCNYSELFTILFGIVPIRLIMVSFMFHQLLLLVFLTSLGDRQL